MPLCDANLIGPREEKLLNFAEVGCKRFSKVERAYRLGRARLRPTPW